MFSDYFFREKLQNKFPVLRNFKNTVVNRYRKFKSNYGKKILDNIEGNQLIGELIASNNPLMIARLGATELACVVEYLEKREKGKKWSDSIKKRMSTLSGFFPATDDMLDRFSVEFLEHVSNVDVMGIWYNPKEDKICRNYCPNASYVALKALEPYYVSDPWSQYLANRKVLVIHPYDETITSQFINKRKLLFNNEKVLPPFELSTIKAVQSIANNKTPFKNWFEALEYMCDEITKKDFDIAIIGAGAYGLPLASFVKNMGKQAVHMGGATQILFGIKGKRWDSHEFISKLYNEHWVRPSIKDIPKNYKDVEGGCYW
ncbi:hypothetical protein [Geobacillus zalihae]|uniref:hypothetical protein n=1 Tax=Geobacillus zalihae TaxID=213419 RepID=UPI001680A977|nr:hypothetical protein [Geobacillus zalihae]QNU23476.1 hypothetical protein IC806_09930 [Geobacillus zalihae]